MKVEKNSTHGGHLKLCQRLHDFSFMNTSQRDVCDAVNVLQVCTAFGFGNILLCQYSMLSNDLSAAAGSPNPTPARTLT